MSVSFCENILPYEVSISVDVHDISGCKVLLVSNHYGDELFHVIWKTFPQHLFLEDASIKQISKTMSKWHN
jgi:hypothetical protein